MIYATDVNDEFVTYWHTPPPPHSLTFVVGRQEWNQTGGLTVRHIWSWHFPDLPPKDEQGWVPVPFWWRAMA